LVCPPQAGHCCWRRLKHVIAVITPSSSSLCHRTTARKHNMRRCSPLLVIALALAQTSSAAWVDVNRQPDRSGSRNRSWLCRFWWFAERFPENCAPESPPSSSPSSPSFPPPDPSPPPPSLPPPAPPSPPGPPPQCNDQGGRGYFCRFCRRVPEALLHVTAGVPTSSDDDDGSAFDMLGYFLSMDAPDSPDVEKALILASDTRSDGDWVGKEVLKSGGQGAGKSRGKGGGKDVGKGGGRGGGWGIDDVVAKCFDLSAAAQEELTQQEGLLKPCAFLIKACNRRCPSPQCERPSDPPPATSPSAAPSAAPTAYPTGLPSAAPTAAPTAS